MSHQPFTDICKTGALCGNCMNPQTSAEHRAFLRTKFEGVPADGEPCNYAANPKPWGTVAVTVSAKFKPIPLAVVEERLAMPCPDRTPDGRCPKCKTCGQREGGGPPCREIAASPTRPCPNNIWQAPDLAL